MSQTHKKTKLIALVLAGLIFLNVNFVSAAVNQTLKDGLLPFVDIKYDYVNGIIDEVTIYNRALSLEEIKALYSLSPQGMGEMWNCTIRAIDSTGAEGIDSKGITIAGYVLPNITDIKITPSPAYDDSELNCSAIYGDPDGNKGNVTLSWYNGSSLFWQATQYNKMNGEQINEPLTWVDKNGLVGYWKFSDGNGTQVRDISGNENNGTLTNFNFNGNSGWSDGKYGKALLFDGSNDYVSVNDNNLLDLTTSGTIGFWIYPKGNNTSGWQFLLSKDGTSDERQPYSIQYPPHTNERIALYLGNNVASQSLTSNTPIRLNTWYHVVFTWNSSNKTVYINGDYDNRNAFNSGIIPFNSNTVLAIGMPPSRTTYPFNGTLDEVMIFNRTLSDAEISALYQNSPHASDETWNCTINAIDSAGMTGTPNSKAITIGSQSAQNYTPKWVHVTVTYNKATKQKKIYVNGNLTRTETLQGLSDYKINNQAGNLYAGKLYGLPAGNPFNGSIDEILISPKEKSAAEIWQDYLNNIIYSEMPGPNEAKTMAIEGENITEISIAPIVKVSNKEKTCDVTSKVKLPECVQ